MGMLLNKGFNANEKKRDNGGMRILFTVSILRAHFAPNDNDSDSDSVRFSRYTPSMCALTLFVFSFFSRLVADTLKPSVAMQQNEYLSIYCTVFVVVVAGAVVQL